MQPDTIATTSPLHHRNISDDVSPRTMYENVIMSQKKRILDQDNRLSEYQKKFSDRENEFQKLKVVSLTKESQLNEFRTSAVHTDKLAHRLQVLEADRTMLEKELLKLREEQAKTEEHNNHMGQVHRDLLADLEDKNNQNYHLESKLRDLTATLSRFQGHEGELSRSKETSLLLALELERQVIVGAERTKELDGWVLRYKELHAKYESLVKQADGTQSKLTYAEDILKENQIVKNKLELLQEENARLTHRLNHDNEMNTRQTIVKQVIHLIMSSLLVF